MMIISCTNCNKKFEINSDLIPDTGRLLACGGCNYEWFYTKEKLVDSQAQEIEKKDLSTDSSVKKIEITEISDQVNISEPSENFIDNDIKNNSVDKIGSKKLNNKVGINLLSWILIFLLSFVALVILIDTFKSPIGLFIPNIELILFNLYETLKDILLFVQDLIR